MTASELQVRDLPLRHGGDPLSPRLPLERLERERDRRLLPFRFPDGVVGWVTTNVADFRAALSDPRLHAKRFLGEPQPTTVSVEVPDMPGFIPSMNGPEHLRIRRLASGDFSVKAVERLRPFITEVVDCHLDAMEQAGPPVDLIRVFNLPVPSAVVGHILGVPSDESGAFQKAAEETIGQRKDGRDDPQMAARAVARLQEILGEVIEVRRKEPRDDLISRLVTADPRLSDEEIKGLCTNLLLAGHDTTAAASAVALTLLLENPDQLQAFVEHPERVARSVEELVRFVFVIAESGAGIPRLVTEDMELAGQQLRAGDWVMPATGLANIDPAVCPQSPLELDITRKEVVPHMAFGFGAHTCLGQHLARAELQIMLTRLLQRFPTIRLERPPADLDWNDEALIYRMYALPVSWSPPALGET